METILVCGHCEGTIKNLYSYKPICSNCGIVKGALKPITNLKEFLGEGYYWYDAIVTILGKDFDRYVDSFGRDGIIFTKNKHRGKTPSRQRWIKKWSSKTIDNNDNIEPYAKEFIARGIPLCFEQSYLLIKDYLGGEEKVYVERIGETNNINKYIDKKTMMGLKHMCNKYLKVLNGELSYDDAESFVLFTMENKIDKDKLISIMGSKRIIQGKHNDILEIYNKYKKLP